MWESGIVAFSDFEVTSFEIVVFYFSIHALFTT